jgi:hypothetical protein
MLHRCHLGGLRSSKKVISPEANIPSVDVSAALMSKRYGLQKVAFSYRQDPRLLNLQ